MKLSKIFLLSGLALLFINVFSFAADITHVVEKGDTLYSIGRKYGVSVDEICSANKIKDPSKVKLGQSLRIPQKSSAVSKSSSQSSSNVDYLVQPGDTLFSIAKNYNTSVAAIRSANNMSESATLRSGQRIIVPSGSSSVQTSASYLAAVKPETSAQAPITDPRSYQTKRVDTATVWPVKANELCYVEGKTNSVVLNGNRGDSVTAVKGGTVIFSGLYRGFGKVVFIQPKSSDYVYVYSGLDTLAVQKGDNVDYGAVIGKLGIDTRTQKPQLNFMVFKNGAAIDPAIAPRG